MPEVERARALIDDRGLGRRIAAVDDRDTYVSRPHSPGEIAVALTGAKLTAVHRRGKSLWLETDRGPILGLHLGMAGRIVIDGRGEGDPAPDGGAQPWDRFRIEFEDGGSLALRDKRRLSRARLEPDIERLGPDAGEIGRSEFRERIRGSRAPIKARVMDQSVIAGVGNLLADEALWRARIDPRRPADSLSDEEIDGLRRDLRAAIRSAIAKGGVHTGRVIPARRAGGACPRCAAEMHRGRIGGRTTWWCPAEQH